MHRNARGGACLYAEGPATVLGSRRRDIEADLQPRNQHDTLWDAVGACPRCSLLTVRGLQSYPSHTNFVGCSGACVGFEEARRVVPLHSTAMILAWETTAKDAVQIDSVWTRSRTEG